MRVPLIERDVEPVTLREPTVPPPSPRPRPAVFDALCAAVGVLAGEELSCELDVVVDAGRAAAVYRDPEMAARMLSPFVSRMPPRDGCTAIGTLRVGDRRVRIYERVD